MVLFHLVQQITGRGVERAHQRPQAGVFTLVMAVQESIIQAKCSAIAVRCASPGADLALSATEVLVKSRRRAEWTMPIIAVSAGPALLDVTANPSLEN